MEMVISIIYTSLLIIIFVIDLENFLVLDIVVYPGMVLALAFSFFWPGLDILSSLEGGAIGLVAMALPFLIYRRGMGMGDVKLGALVGLMSGFPFVFITLLLAMIAGGLVGASLLILGIKKRTDSLPFAVFLAAAAMVTLLWGQAIYHWYHWYLW